MNILFICDEYPPGRSGGVGSMTAVLARELVRKGHRVFVVGLYTYGYGQADYEEDHGVQVWRFRYGLRLNFPQDHFVSKVVNRIPGFLKQHLNGRRAFEKFCAFIAELIRKEGINVIEIPDWNTFAMRIGFVVQWPRFEVPLVLKSHGSYTKICHDLGKVPVAKLHLIDRLLYSRADAIAAVSRDCASIDEKLFCPSKPIDVLYNGIELPRLSNARREEHKAVFTGTLVAPKGIYELARGWNIVHAKLPSARLDVFGKGNSREVAAKLSPEALKSVTFYGHVPRSRIYEALSTASVAVFPSFTESFALAPLEAMAIGCPVIYTERSSGKELITHGDNGSLVDPSAPAQIAEAILELFRNPELRRQYSERGRRTVEERFEIGMVAENHLNYYRQIIDNFNRR